MNKKLQPLRSLTLGAAVLATSTAMLTTNATAFEANLTGNAGILSDYIFRGIPQSSGTGNGGVDLEIGGFYAGTWIADVEDEGIEQDWYAGYVHEFTNGLSLGAGFTSYQYPDNFDNEYNEVNLYAGWSNDVWSLDLEYSDGEYNGDFLDDAGNVEGDEYGFVALTLGWNGAYITYGDFTEDADDDLGSYWEFGYGFDVVGLDFTAAVVHTDANILNSGGDDDDDETQAYVGISKSFDIMKWGNGS